MKTTKRHLLRKERLNLTLQAARMRGQSPRLANLRRTVRLLENMKEARERLVTSKEARYAAVSAVEKQRMRRIGNQAAHRIESNRRPIRSNAQVEEIAHMFRFFQNVQAYEGLNGRWGMQRPYRITNFVEDYAMADASIAQASNQTRDERNRLIMRMIILQHLPGIRKLPRVVEQDLQLLTWPRRVGDPTKILDINTLYRRLRKEPKELRSSAVHHVVLESLLAHYFTRSDGNGLADQVEQTLKQPLTTQEKTSIARRVPKFSQLSTEQRAAILRGHRRHRVAGMISQYIKEVHVDGYETRARIENQLSKFDGITPADRSLDRAANAWIESLLKSEANQQFLARKAMEWLENE